MGLQSVCFLFALCFFSLYLSPGLQFFVTPFNVAGIDCKHIIDVLIKLEHVSVGSTVVKVGTPN